MATQLSQTDEYAVVKRYISDKHGTDSEWLEAQRDAAFLAGTDSVFLLESSYEGGGSRQERGFDRLVILQICTELLDALDSAKAAERETEGSVQLNHSTHYASL